MAWWYHPDRREDFRKRIEGTGARDFSLTESTTDGMRVRTAQWKDRRGGEQRHYIETRLGPTGMAARSGDRFIAPGRDVVTYQPPWRRSVTVSCNGRIEFIPRSSGETEIRAFHDHTMTGGLWLQHWCFRKCSPKAQERQFVEQIDRCRAATSLSISTGQPD
jgi:hypothetical protein